jgi:hypothetical protein
MESLALDLRHALRALRRQPVYGVAAVLTLALGLGGVLICVGLFDIVLLRQLPYPRADRLYALSATVPGPSGEPACCRRWSFSACASRRARSSRSKR